VVAFLAVAFLAVALAFAALVAVDFFTAIVK
ncbi:MAG: hypothetical protein ACI9VN_001919, partial [Patescibacteria group bacterium]